MQTPGVVGVGAMGTVIVERFIAGGLSPVVFDVSTEAIRRATDLGATAAESPEEVARAADIVSVMVRTDQEMLDCVLGEHGVLSCLSDGEVLLLHSTIHPIPNRSSSVSWSVMNCLRSVLSAIMEIAELSFRASSRLEVRRSSR